jgi:DNA-binding GntR family transcriptional regulator
MKKVVASVLKRSVLSDQTYDMARAMIFSHEIEPGQRVRIDALAIKLGVSQTPIREALARLESDGLIAKEALKGYTSTKLLTAKEFASLFDFRLLIEPWAAEHAALNGTDSQRIALCDEVELVGSVIANDFETQWESLTAHDARFHSLIASMSGNLSVADAFERTHCHLHQFRLFIATQKKYISDAETTPTAQTLFERYYQSGSGQSAVNDHGLIATAILAKNGPAARKEMTSHIEASQKRLQVAMHEVNN